MGSKIKDCKLITFYQGIGEKGELYSAHAELEIPFPVKRVYYLHHVDPMRISGKHANRTNQQVMVAIQGSFHVRIHDGKDETSFFLDKPSEGLWVREQIWREVYGFSEDAVCLVFCSENYKALDYIKDFSEFLAAKHAS